MPAGLDDLEAMMFTTDDRDSSVSLARPITCSFCEFHNPSGAKKCQACESTLIPPPSNTEEQEDEEEEKEAPLPPRTSMSSPRGVTRDRPSFEEANVGSIDEKEAAKITEAYEKMATKYRTANLNIVAFRELIGQVFLFLFYVLFTVRFFFFFGFLL